MGSSIRTTLADWLGIKRDANSGGASLESMSILTPEQYGCLGEYEARSQGNWNGVSFGDTYFKFLPKHIGWSFWQDGNLRTITGVTEDFRAIISPNGYGSTNINWRIRGQDDTPYFQLFLNACSPDYDPSNPTNTFPENVIGLNGALKFGRIGVMNSMKTYPVFNSAAQSAGGKTACLFVRRRTCLRTLGTGPAGATIVACPGTYGHVVSNRDTSAYTDFVDIGNFTINGEGDFCANGLDALHWETPYGNYDKVDPYSTFRSIRVDRAARHGFYFHGKGEVKIRDCDAFSCKSYGMFITGQYDVSVIGGQFGGNSKTGFRIDSPGPIQVTGIKSFYSGSNGGSNDEDCANIVLENLSGDYHSGGGFLVNCMSQESRGAGLVIKIRNCLIDGCQIQDPNRQTIGTGTRPTVKTGIYLKGPVACGNVFSNTVVMPALTEYATPNWVVDTSIIHIDGDNPFSTANGGPQNNVGDIRYPIDYIMPGNTVLKGVTFTGSGAATSGNGCINGKNTGLRINGVALT